MTTSQSKGGRARAQVLSPMQRTEIARKAARTRWAGAHGLLSLRDIRECAGAIARDARYKAKVVLFGSYARGSATKDSDIDLLVIEDGLVDWRVEAARLRRVARKHAGGKDVDLVVMSEVDYHKWHRIWGTVQHEAAREGVTLVH